MPPEPMNKEGSRLPPRLLQPPATIISPPSPIEPKSSHPPTFASPPQPRESLSSPDVEYDSPTSDPSLSDDEDRPRAASTSLGSKSKVISPMSSSPPQATPSYLHPESPGLPSSPRAGTSSRPSSPRSPSPSSPHYKPRRPHQRRESSSHRVRETMDGHQSNNEAGDRMVNQYKIGKALGRGAYAKVELGIDVGTGVEYVSFTIRGPLLQDILPDRIYFV